MPRRSKAVRKFRPRVTSAITAATLTALAGVSWRRPDNARRGGFVRGGRQRGLRRRRQLRRDVHQRLHRAAQPRHRGREPRRLVGAVPLGQPAPPATWQVTPLSGSIAPGAIYLVAEAAGTGGTQPPARRRRPPAPSTMSGTSGTVAVVNGTAPLTCSDSAACQAASRRPRRLRHGGHQRGGPRGRRVATPTRCSARTRPTATTTPATSPPAPRPPAPPTCGGDGGGTGDGDARPAAHPRHPGLELARRRTTASRSPTCPASSPASARRASSRGYWIQDPDPDSSPATSEGIFVFTSSPGGGGRRLGARVRHRPRLLSAVERRLRRHDLEPVGDRDRDPDGHRALARQPAAGARGDRAGHRARRLRPGPQRRATSSRRRSRRAARRSTSGSRARGCASRSTTPGWSARPTASASSSSPPSRRRRPPTAAAPRSWPRTPSPRAASRSCRPTAPTPTSTWATCSPAPRWARSTTRSSAAT